MRKRPLLKGGGGATWGVKALVPYLWIFLGSGLGGTLRHGVSHAGAALFGGGFPVATLLVNLIGCFAIGVLTSLFAFRGEWASQHARLFLTTGILGGFTTFSAFSLDTAVLLERGQGGLAVAYVAASVGGALMGVIMGLSIGRAVFR